MHSISGIIGTPEVLREFSRGRGLHAAAGLESGLAFLPLGDGELDELFPVPGAFDPAMVYLSDALKQALASLSAAGCIAWVETDYFGGAGEQGAALYKDGSCVLPPRQAAEGVISEALRAMGVRRTDGPADEFATVGLGRHRSNQDWIDEAASGVELPDTQ